MKPYGFSRCSMRAPSAHSSNSRAVHTSTISTPGRVAALRTRAPRGAAMPYSALAEAASIV